jgi:hypothetical protein
LKQIASSNCVLNIIDVDDVDNNVDCHPMISGFEENKKTVNDQAIGKIKVCVSSKITAVFQVATLSLSFYCQHRP